MVEATHVYLLMNDAVRISRNSRASWYLKQLNGIIDTSRVQALVRTINSHYYGASLEFSPKTFLTEFFGHFTKICFRICSHMLSAMLHIILAT